MLHRMIAIIVIFLGLTAAWFVLAGSVLHRTWNTDDRLKNEVAALWGDQQEQTSPEIRFLRPQKVTDTETVEDPVTKQKSLVTREREVEVEEPQILDGSKIAVGLSLEQRKKGLLWYSTYGVDFEADYLYVHDSDQAGAVEITYRFPTTLAIYDRFRFEVNGVMDPSIVPVDDGGVKVVRARVPVTKGSRVPFTVAYASRGLDGWRYSFGKNVNRVKNFELALTTDFSAIDYPAGTISPQTSERVGAGWKLRWVSDNLISGFAIGMEMPRRINPGPLAAEMTYFAPVCLFFFFVWMFVITLMKRIELHPMNYLFLGAAFFAFHLLFAYSVDHIDVVPAFIVASIVSVFLVISYLRLVVGLRFAAIEAGVSQLVYLVFFSWAHFLEGFTGLIVTIGGVLTLFALMQLTGRTRWSEIDTSRGQGSPVAPEAGLS